MSIPARIASAWKSAQLLIVFHRGQDGRPLDVAKFWRPKNATAGVGPDARRKEAILAVAGEGAARDVEIKLRSDKIILRREDSPDALGWSGIRVDHFGVSVLVDGIWITVEGNGTVKRDVEGQDDTSWLEADGTFFRIGPDAEIIVSGNGVNITRRTHDRFDAITERGAVSRERRRPLKDDTGG